MPSGGTTQTNITLTVRGNAVTFYRLGTSLWFISNVFTN
jgi:hypothetical protein